MESRETMKKLNELLAMVESAYLRIAKENNLTYNQLMLLLMLEGTETLTQKQVCDALYLSKSSVHTMLTVLIKRGYLALGEGGNKKEKYIVPTENGEKFTHKIADETAHIEDSALQSVSEKEMTRFLRTAEMLAFRLTDEALNFYVRK